jgi:auxin efflux carrier family
MGLQERILVCGTYWTIVGMGLRFLLGPALFAAASLLVGLRGVSLHVSIVQVLQTHYPTSLVARSIF